MKIRKVIPNWRYPEASERALARKLDDAVSKVIATMSKDLSAIKFDDADESIEAVTERIEQSAISSFLSVISRLFSIGLAVYKFNSKQWLSIAIAGGGGGNHSVMKLNESGPKKKESWFKPKIKQWQSMATDSIKKLASDIVSDWVIKIRSESLKGSSPEKIKAEVAKRYAIYGSWSRNRASGIIGSFNSMLMMQRLLDAKVTHYIWRGVMDKRERLSHVKLEGKRRIVNGDGIFPGEEYGCRCWAVPDWKTAGG